jgi:CAAX prenyl protease-like protein
MPPKSPLPFVIPFALYLLGTSLIASLGVVWYPVGYAAVVALVGGVTWFLLRREKILLVHGSVWQGVLVGVVGVAAWIVLSHLRLESWLAQWLPDFLKPGDRVSYNPFENLKSVGALWGFILVRVIGIAIVVPIIEEVFWRGFLLRWLIDPDWEKIPIGTYTLSSCMWVALLFALAHPEWLAAAAYCLLLNGLLYWRRDLWLCVVAHATSNLLLAVYVLATGAWWLW